MGFADGFRMGADIGQRRIQNERQARLDEQAAKEAAARLEQMGLQTDALRRQAAQQDELGRMRVEISDFATGLNRPATNAALDADFAAADQAALAGRAMPAVQGGSNMANQQALAVRNPVNMNSPEYQAGMAGLRQRYALAAGDMKDFDAITTAERARMQGVEDSNFAKAVIADPQGEAAKNARAWINKNSNRMSTKVDPKTGLTTFAITNGDSYDEVKVNPADLAKIAVGYRRLERGDVGGLDVIAAVNKDLAAAVKEEMRLQLDVGGKNNDAVAKGAAMANDTARLDVERQRLGVQRAVADQASSQILGANMNYTLGANGQLVPTMTGLKLNRKTGQYETVNLPMTGSGVVPAGALDPAKISKAAEGLVGQPTGQLDAKGKPVVYTADTAYGAIQQRIVNSFTAANGGNDPVKAIADAIREQQAKAQAPAPAAAPAAPARAPAPSRDPSKAGLVDQVAPAARAANSAMNDRYVAYLQGKIQRNEPLGPVDRARAVQFGLMPQTQQ